MDLDITIDTMIIPEKTLGQANIGVSMMIPEKTLGQANMGVTMMIPDDSRRSSGNNRRFDDDSRGNS
jgi:hypothetical protein